jgi:thiol-disulfide isomerase/thioredoxin
MNSTCSKTIGQDPRPSKLTFWMLLGRGVLMVGVVLPMVIATLFPLAQANMSEGEPALIVLTASWCAKCRDLPDVIDPTLAALGSPSLRVVMLDVDNPSTTEVANRYGISLNGNDVPQIYFYRQQRTQLLLTASEHQQGHAEETQVKLLNKVRPLL